ncbi:hypothetical protein AB0K51_13670 [Kitasatospora sp. NPDC049285]|uniref:hypothetical protein n=1 Tax=Kitasatospora sp. NPDC049285 TaxID=3157096 RepID=UPI003418693C
MTLMEGQRVRLVADLGLGEAFAGEDGPGIGFLLLGAGVEGTVERLAGELPPGEGVREYERLKALFEDYGHTMPEESRKRLADEVAALQPQWEAFRRQGPRSAVRVRFDNGFVLDGVDEDVFAPV